MNHITNLFCIVADSEDKSGLWAVNSEDEYHEESSNTVDDGKRARTA